MTTTWHAEWAWLGEAGIGADVVLVAADGVFARVEVGVPRPADAVPLPGLTLPGLVNVHSHAFHRALRGRTHTGAADFWAWRDRMYAVAGRIDPDTCFHLARAAYAEMALAGITTVGEFHYLHHGPDGVPYSDPNAMAEALRAAAAAAGVRLTLLDTLYLQAGVGGAVLDPVQRRFSDGSDSAWRERVEPLVDAWAADPACRVGAAIHSVRAVDPAAMRGVVGFGDEHGAPLHVHVSEQPAENESCLTAYGQTPVALLESTGALGPRTTAVHATHVTADDVSLLAASGAAVCLCPTTERDLADGIGPARSFAGRSVPLVFGSDSHAVVDLFEEARAAELDERLASGSRAGLRAIDLLGALTEAGARCLGWPSTGRLAVGCLADFTTVGLGSVRLAGLRQGDLTAGVVFAATAADVTDVVVAGDPVVRSGTHLLVDDVPGALAMAIAAVDP